MLQPTSIQKHKNPVNIVAVYKTLRVPLPCTSAGDCVIQAGYVLPKIMACSGIPCDTCMFYRPNYEQLITE